MSVGDWGAEQGRHLKSAGRAGGGAGELGSTARPKIARAAAWPAPHRSVGRPASSPSSPRLSCLKMIVLYPERPFSLPDDELVCHTVDSEEGRLVGPRPTFHNGQIMPRGQRATHLGLARLRKGQGCQGLLRNDPVVDLACFQVLEQDQRQGCLWRDVDKRRTTVGKGERTT